MNSNEQLMETFEHLENKLKAVSYTYLDVYKRQEWDTVMNYPFYLNLIDLLAD